LIIKDTFILMSQHFSFNSK